MVRHPGGMQNLMIFLIFIDYQISSVNGVACSRSVPVLNRQAVFVAYSDDLEKTSCAIDEANKTVGTRSLIQCSMVCQSESECQFYNWKREERNSCELFFYEPTEFRSMEGCTLFSIREFIIQRPFIFTHEN